ncbi:MAG: hypothetical protein GX432_03525 [Candidatus Atribacteria bacterium]|nr:hypothetical protein [Candidatus Atribacteria bacterium]
MREVLEQVANLMAIAARTAPKSGGSDYVHVQVIKGNDVQKIGEEMIQYGEQKNISGFIRDGKNVVASDVLVLIGIKDAVVMNLNCGACGYDSCQELKPIEKNEFKGPQCMFRLLDLGIALGSAVKTASLLNVDNRIMYRVGAIARKMGFTQDDVVMGIPLSAQGKNIYFDRKG